MLNLQGNSRLTSETVMAFAELLLTTLIIASPAAGVQMAGIDAHTAVHAVAPTADADARAVTHGRIRLATGVELHVAQAGPTDGVPVLLVHGFTDSWFSWTPVLERLPAGVRAIVPTQRGHGDSERPVCCYRVGDFTRDAVALLDALGIERAHVVGHSMGGLIAQRIAIDSPERVDRLVIIGAAASARNDVIIEFNEIVQQLEDPIDPAFIRDFQLGTTAVPLPPAFLDGVVHESGKLPARIWRDVLGGLVDPAQANDASGIRAPTLVVWGAKDALFPRSSQDSLVRAIRGSRLVVYPEAAHSPNWEIPDRVVADLVAFLGLAG
jgi:pimeloyl-ACP methyl ester carboxylesterase